MNCFQAASADFFESAETSAPPLYNLYAALPVFLYKSTRSTVKFSKTEQGHAIFSRGGPACPPAFRPIHRRGAGAHIGAPLRQNGTFLDLMKRSNHPHGRNGTFLDFMKHSSRPRRCLRTLAQTQSVLCYVLPINAFAIWNTLHRGTEREFSLSVPTVTPRFSARRNKRCRAYFQ